MNQGERITKSIKARREYSGPAFLSGAFRPFFLAASIWAAIAVAIWLYAQRAAGGAVNIDMLWHSHEMIFGFASAAIAGFILTAVPNWTGRLPVRGMALAGLALLWLLGRLAMLAEGFFGLSDFAWLDLLFLFVLAFVVAREIIIGKNRRNIIVALFILLLAIANLLMQFEMHGVFALSGHGWRLGLAMLVMLLSLIGGRITPSFTRNWLARQGVQNLPKQPGRFDMAALVLTLIALLFWVFAPQSALSGYLLLLAGLGQGLRLLRWRGLASLSAPIVFILHVGFGWIGLGLIILGLSVIWHIMPASTAIHALTIGAVGTMISAVASRASLGHSGREIRAGWLLSGVYLLISLAAVLRLAGLWIGSFDPVFLSGIIWIIGYGLFALLFIGIWFLPRPPRP